MTPLAVSALIAAALADPRPSPGVATRFAVADPLTTQLANGLDVVLHRQVGTGTVTVELAFGFGEYVDPPGKEGAAAVLLDLMAEGSSGGRDGPASARLARLGATVGAGQHDDTAVLTLTTATTAIEDVVPIWAGLVRDPHLDPRAFGRVRARHLARAELDRDDPLAVAWDVLWATRYGPTYVGRHPTPGSIGAIAVDDCRKVHRAHLGPSNAVVLVQGDVDPQRLFALLDAHLGDWSPIGVVPAPVEIASPAPNGERIYAVDWPGLVEAVVLSVQPIPSPSHPTHAAFEVGVHAFAGALGSRVNRNLGRLDRSSQALTCDQRHRHGEGYLICGARVPVDLAVPTVEQVRSEWFGVLSDEERLTAAEVVAARESLADHWPVRLAAPAARLDLELAIWRYGLPEDGPAEYIPRVRGVDAEQANEALRERLSLERTQWVVVGDLGSMSRKPASTGILVEHRDRDGRPVPDSTALGAEAPEK